MYIVKTEIHIEACQHLPRSYRVLAINAEGKVYRAEVCEAKDLENIKLKLSLLQSEALEERMAWASKAQRCLGNKRTRARWQAAIDEAYNKRGV